MKTRRGPAGRGPSRKMQNPSGPIVERVEDRVMLSPFFVTNTSDQGAGSLRQAIIDSNASTTQLPNTITFQLPPGTQTIAVGSTTKTTLPAITQQVVIDGTSAENPANPNRPTIQILGNNVNLPPGPAFQVNSAGVTIRALVIDNFIGTGIILNGGTSTIQDCYIGVSPTGIGRAGNFNDGIDVASPNNTIGGTTAAARNVISANFEGINITGASSTGNLIQGNFIGTDETGKINLGNFLAAIAVGSANNTIGGSTTLVGGSISGAGNVLSGNGTGVSISNANSNVVEGNFIGVDSTGNGSLGNSSDGIDIALARNTIVGTGDPLLRNIISSNGFDGINVSSSSSFNNRIQGNYIGVGADGITALGNKRDGVFVNGAVNTLIGGTVLNGTAPMFGNVIGNNGNSIFNGDGVQILGSQNNGILSNRIFNSGALGIALQAGGNGGVTPPTILMAQSGAAQTRITGTYFGIPNTAYRLQFFSNVVANPGGGEGQNFLGDLDITTNSVGNFKFSTTLPAGVPVGDFVSATATQQVLQINNTSQFSTDVQVTQAQVTNLGVTTALPAGPPLLNQNYTFSVTVTNFGPNDATGVLLTDMIPTNSTFVSASAGQFGNGVLTDNIGNLPNGASVTVTITVKPINTSAMFVNTATVTGNELDTDLTNNTSTTTSTVATNADLQATLTVSANPAPVGSPITYTLVVGNNGPSTVNDATAIVTLPANLTNLVITPDQGTFTLAGNVLTLNLGILPASSSSTTTIMGTPSTVGPINTTAQVFSSLQDPNPANNGTGLAVNILNAADLALTMGASPDPVLSGQELFYTLTVTNNGPSLASQPVVLDPLPAGLTFVAADSNAGGSGTLQFNNGTVTALLNPLAAGAVATITIAAIPSTPTFSGQVTNTAIVGDPSTTNPVELDPDLTNNAATTTTQVNPADLSVTVANPPDPLVIGTPAAFQVQVTNNGPATATNVILTENLGANGTIVSSSVGTPSGGSLVVNLGSLASGATTTVTIVVQPTASGTLLDAALVASDQFDPNPNNNSASSSNLVSPVDVAVVLVATPNPVLIGGQVIYTATITNNGPTTATNVLFNDTLPAGAVLASATTSQGIIAPSSGTTISGNLGTLAPGSSATVVILVTTNAVSTATDTASVSSDGFDTNPANNTASASVSVINLPGAIVVGTPLVFVPENGGSATITLDRIGGTLGVVTVNYTTVDFTAVSGVNYTGASGVVTFADGQTVATITIPVLDDLKVDGNNGFFVVLSNPTGGSTLSANNTAAVVVTNTDRDTIPPAVIGLIGLPNGQALNGFVVFFDKAMDPGRASLVSNYHVFLSADGAGGGGLMPVPLAAALYTPFNNSVTLVPTQPLPSNRLYRVVVNGSFGPALTDVSGNVLSGFAGPGSNYDVFFGQGTALSYIDSQANAVALTLTGGGTMTLFQGINGQVAALNLYNVVPHKSVLTGTVKKLNKFSSGQTTIDAITGLGTFGDVATNLTTPPFYVIFDQVAYTSINGPTEVSAAAISTPSILSGKKTPKGPLKG